MAVGDLLARDAAGMHLDDVDQFRRLAEGRARASVRASRPLGRPRSRARRPYRRSSPLRRRAPVQPGRPATARTRAHVARALAAPMTKRFEPSREREVLLALDIQTSGGAGWDIADRGDAGRRGAVRGRCLARPLVGSRRLVLRLDGGRLHADTDALRRRRHRPRRASGRPRAGHAGATVTVPVGSLRGAAGAHPAPLPRNDDGHGRDHA